MRILLGLPKSFIFKKKQMEKIRFIINYEVQERRKFEDFLDCYRADIGFDFKELKIEKYWKIKEQFQANFFIETKIVVKEKRIYEILTLANKLFSTEHSNWTIQGPFENENLIFECVLNNENLAHPVRWAHLALENE